MQAGDTVKLKEYVGNSGMVYFFISAGLDMTTSRGVIQEHRQDLKHGYKVKWENGITIWHDDTTIEAAA